MKVLITAGGTREPIDSVRSITNASTGATGAAIADAFARLGHSVLYLHSIGAVRPTQPCECMTFDTFEEFADLLEGAVRGFDPDLIVQAAAVSDYRVADRATHKLETQGDLTLRLSANPKLIDHLRAWSPRPTEVRIIGFKLVDGLDSASAEARARDTLKRAQVDAVVLNDKATFAWGQDHRFECVLARTSHVQSFAGRQALAQGLAILDWSTRI